MNNANANAPGGAFDQAAEDILYDPDFAWLYGVDPENQIEPAEIPPEQNGAPDVQPLGGPPQQQIGFGPIPHDVEEIQRIQQQHNANAGFAQVAIEQRRIPYILDANILIPSYVFDEEFMGYAVDQLMPPAHNLSLSDEHVNALMNQYGQNPLLAGRKMRVIAHLVAAKDVLEASKLTSEAVITRVFLPNQSEYRISMASSDLYSYGQRLAVCRKNDYESGHDFQVYFASVTEERHELRLVIPHVDGPTPRFAENQVVRLYVPPDFKIFEAYMTVVEACERDPVFQRKYFPNVADHGPLDDTEPPVSQRTRNTAGLDDDQFMFVRAVDHLNPKLSARLQGPPGTGKTLTLFKTLVNEYQNGLKNGKNCKFLVCAPSNAAANAIAKLFVTDANAGIESRRVFRAYARNVHPASVPAELLPLTQYDGSGSFKVPADKAALVQYDFIICTLTLSAYFKKLGQHYFTHIAIDEAGQALEMETLIPLVYFSNAETKVMIVGDEMQLRPYFVDGVIGQQKFNAALTTLERLAANDCYIANRRINFMLTWNHRSWFGVVIGTSRLFYHGRVRPRLPYDPQLDKFFYSPILNYHRFPMIFHVIHGEEEDVVINGHLTFRNEYEATTVLGYVLRCIQHGVAATEIGVVAPYRGHIMRIEELLTENGIHGVVVDTVERFQGDERSVIIVTTVRTKRMGFLNDYRRLNVAISRPAHMLIIVGELGLLIRNRYWRWYAQYLINYRCIWDQTLIPTTVETACQHWTTRINALPPIPGMAPVPHPPQVPNGPHNPYSHHQAGPPDPFGQQAPPGQQPGQQAPPGQQFLQPGQQPLQLLQPGQQAPPGQQFLQPGQQPHPANPRANVLPLQPVPQQFQPVVRFVRGAVPTIQHRYPNPAAQQPRAANPPGQQPRPQNP